MQKKKKKNTNHPTNQPTNKQQTNKNTSFAGVKKKKKKSEKTFSKDSKTRISISASSFHFICPFLFHLKPTEDEF